MIRGIVTSVVEGVIKRFTASGRADETISNREYLQHYGFTSRPQSGAELIIMREGNNIIAIASDDRRYRISLEEGEVALYDDLGQAVHLTREGVVVTSPKKISASAPTVEISAEVKVLLDTPLLEVTGDIRSGGEVSDRKGTMQAMRDTHNQHVHPVQGSSTAITPQVMT